MGRVTARRRVARIDGASRRTREDALVVEEPFEIRVDDRPLVVTMRTPRDDIDLVHGFLLTEGLIHSADDVSTVRYCAGVDEAGVNTYNTVDVRLAPGVVLPDHSIERSFYATSSCGVCGKASLDAVSVHVPWDIGADPVSVTSSVLADLPRALRAAQPVFERTGGLHAAAAFTADGSLVAAREDVGRHNAVDKLVGHLARTGALPARGLVVAVSGRASFEVVQKLAVAGAPVLAAVSAPSSLAVDLAERHGMTLVGFLRGEAMNVYSRPDRVRDAPTDEPQGVTEAGDPA